SRLGVGRSPGRWFQLLEVQAFGDEIKRNARFRKLIKIAKHGYYEM
ncbi:MAG: hypothetical protein ACJAR1_002166, partial [Rubritalea sp.]